MFVVPLGNLPQKQEIPRFKNRVFWVFSMWSDYFDQFGLFFFFIFLLTFSLWSTFVCQQILYGCYYFLRYNGEKWGQHPEL
jgi:hypothetical protein